MFHLSHPIPYTATVYLGISISLSSQQNTRTEDRSWFKTTPCSLVEVILKVVRLSSHQPYSLNTIAEYIKNQ